MLLLTILSVLAGWAFLSLLVIGLLLILRPLQAVRGYLEKITMGVRAIEHQLVPLGSHISLVAGSLGETADALGTLDAGLAATGRGLEAAAPALRPH
ncbi:hypothetical protein BH23GEM3_BH23GEM3_11440 [soil metagenome]